MKRFFISFVVVCLLICAFVIPGALGASGHCNTYCDTFLAANAKKTDSIATIRVVYPHAINLLAAGYDPATSAGATQYSTITVGGQMQYKHLNAGTITGWQNWNNVPYNTTATFTIQNIAGKTVKNTTMRFFQG